MKLKNVEIIGANNGLSELIEVKIKGKLKFKLFKNKVALENKLEAIHQALDGVEDAEEQKEILEETQDVDIDLISEDELEDIELSMAQIVMLKPILEELEEEQ